MMNYTFTKKERILKWFLIFTALIVSTHAYGQEQPVPLPELVTDRPDQTESASTVPSRSIQLETGLYFERIKLGNTEKKYTAYPTTLLRIGIIKWLELRVEGTHQELIVKEDSRTKLNGFGPLTVGAKVKLWEEKGIRPQTAFMTMVDLPVGDKAFTPANPQASMRLMFKNSLSEKVDLNYNLAYGWEDGEAVKSYSVSIGTGLSNKLSVFGEVFGDKTNGEKAAHCVDAGFTFLVLPYLQLDLAAGTGLNSQAPDYFVTSGFSIRLPRK